jgi:transcriptional regulator with XRE-family HTH domain
MADEVPGPRRSLAEKVQWLLATATPGGKISDTDAAFRIYEATGEKITAMSLYRLRTGQSANPTRSTLDALARTFGVDPGFFFDDYASDAERLGLDQDQVELLAAVREAGMSTAEFRALTGLDGPARKIVADAIERAARAEARRLAAAHDPDED